MFQIDFGEQKFVDQSVNEWNFARIFAPCFPDETHEVHRARSEATCGEMET